MKAKNKSRRSTKTLDLGVEHAGIASFVFIAKVISLAMGGVMLITITRLLGPAQYGIYTLALAISGFVIGFGSLNTSAYFNKNIPKFLANGQIKRIGVIIGDNLIFLCALSLLLIFIGGIFADDISKIIFGSVSYVLYVYLALFGVLWYILYATFSAVLVSFGVAKEVGISSASSLVFQAILSTSLVVLGFGAAGAILGWDAGFLIAFLIVIYYISRHVRIELDIHGMIERLREVITFSIPLTAASVISTLASNFVVIFFGILLISTSAIGQYGIAAKVGQVFDTVSGSISIVLIPMFATAIYNKHSISKVNKLYHNTLYYNLIFTTPLVVYATVLSSDIIFTVFTYTYTLAIVYMPLISIGMLISILWNAAFYMIVSLGRVEKVLRFTLIATTVQILSVIVLGITFGVIGVIVAYFYIGNVVFCLLYFRELSTFGIRIKLRPILKVISSNLILGIVLAPLIFLQIRALYVLIMGIFICIIVYPVALVKTGALTNKDIYVLYRTSSRMPFVGGIFRAILQYSEFFL
jgi:O-antigen/teichoic acid export membrane protein